jgi:GT2 family glycosyltransferase
MEKLTVTATISTKDRYFTTLPSAIMAIVGQTYRPSKLIIFDDGEHRDLREEPLYKNIFAAMALKGIESWVEFSPRAGQVRNHQRAISLAQTDLIWRVDDDNVPEPQTLEKLVGCLQSDPKIGAVGGRIIIPSMGVISAAVSSSRIEDLFQLPNLQWSDHNEECEVDHLHNSFLYRKEAAKHGYCMELSPVGHCEETLFTYEMKRAGWKIMFCPTALSWHMRYPDGGIRSYQQHEYWQRDHHLAMLKFSQWGVRFNQTKLFVLDNGIGDHFMFKMAWPRIKAKFRQHRMFLACCYPQIFADEKDAQIISIAEATQIDGELGKYNVYEWAAARNWDKSLVKAFEAMHLGE